LSQLQTVYIYEFMQTFAKKRSVARNFLSLVFLLIPPHHSVTFSYFLKIPEIFEFVIYLAAILRKSR
jgi:hypothetical protein